MNRYKTGVNYLTQLEDALIAMEKGTVNKSIVLVIGRAVWWLMAEYVREHGEWRKHD